MKDTSEIQKRESQKAGRMVLIGLLVFFAVCMSVNAFFIYTAVTTSWGVVDENAYQTGLHYNDLLEEAQKRKDAERRSH